MVSPRIVVVGLGSPIMTDDAIGLRVSEEIEKMGLENVDCCQEAVGGLDILPVVEGYDYAVIVDAIQTMKYEPGTVMLFSEESFADTVTEASTHDVNLPTAIKIGRNMDGDVMPKQIRFVAVEVLDIMTMSESLTPPVQDALESAKDATLHIIEEFRSLGCRSRTP